LLLKIRLASNLQPSLRVINNLKDDVKQPELRKGNENLYYSFLLTGLVICRIKTFYHDFFRTSAYIYNFLFHIVGDALFNSCNSDLKYKL
jgi:hypothetical protein